MLLGFLVVIRGFVSTLFMVLTWFTCLVRGRCGQFIAICHGTPQYKPSRFARRLCFSASDNGPRRRAASTSIGVGPPN